MELYEIKPGHRYTDNRGNVRLVVAFEGSHPEKAPSRSDRLQYRLLCKRRSSHRVGSVHGTTLSSFAEWARREVKP